MISAISVAVLISGGDRTDGVSDRAHQHTLSGRLVRDRCTHRAVTALRWAQRCERDCGQEAVAAHIDDAVLAPQRIQPGQQCPAGRAYVAGDVVVVQDRDGFTCDGCGDGMA